MRGSATALQLPHAISAGWIALFLNGNPYIKYIFCGHTNLNPRYCCGLWAAAKLFKQINLKIVSIITLELAATSLGALQMRGCDPPPKINIFRDYFLNGRWVISLEKVRSNSNLPKILESSFSYGNSYRYSSSIKAHIQTDVLLL